MRIVTFCNFVSTNLKLTNLVDMILLIGLIMNKKKSTFKNTDT